MSFLDLLLHHDNILKGYSPAGVVHEDGSVAELVAVEGGVADADVVGEPANKNVRHAFFHELTVETRLLQFLVVEEGAVAVHLGVGPFVNERRSFDDFNIFVDLRAPTVLNAVARPKLLLSHGRTFENYCVEELSLIRVRHGGAGMELSQGDVVQKATVRS